MEPTKTPELRESEEEEGHEQKQAYLKSHHNPRCLKWETGECLEEKA